MRAFAFFAALFISGALAADGQEVIVRLTPTNQVVKRGDTPTFVVTVVAKKSKVRVMKFGARADLRDSYARLVVTHNGSPIEVPRLISDPGPTGESDYDELQPGKELFFTHDGLPFVLSKLPPGDYTATVELQPDWRAEAVTSNTASFRVSDK